MILQLEYIHKDINIQFLLVKRKQKNVFDTFLRRFHSSIFSFNAQK